MCRFLLSNMPKLKSNRQRDACRLNGRAGAANGLQACVLCLDGTMRTMRVCGELGAINCKAFHDQFHYECIVRAMEVKKQCPLCRERITQVLRVPARLDGVRTFKEEADRKEEERKRATEDRRRLSDEKRARVLAESLPTSSLRERLGRLLRMHGPDAGMWAKRRVDIDDHQLRTALEALGPEGKTALVYASIDKTLRECLMSDMYVRRGFNSRHEDESF